jgi:hypothetical protein
VKTFRTIFDSRLTVASAIIFVLFVAVVIITAFTRFPFAHPLIGVLLFGLAVVLFVVGGIIFIIAILKS